MTFLMGNLMKMQMKFKCCKCDVYCTIKPCFILYFTLFHASNINGKETNAKDTIIQTDHWDCFVYLTLIRVFTFLQSIRTHQPMGNLQSIDIFSTLEIFCYVCIPPCVMRFWTFIEQWLFSHTTDKHDYF